MTPSKGSQDWAGRNSANDTKDSSKGGEISNWKELARALGRSEPGYFRRLATAARESSAARFVAIARAAEAGQGISFVAVDGPAGTVACLTEESFAPIWRQALESRQMIWERLEGTGRQPECAALCRQGIESVVVIPLEGLSKASAGLLLAGLDPGADADRVRASLELYAPLASLALMEESRAHRTRVNDQWLAALVESIESGVLLVEPRGRLRHVSPRLAPLLGLDPARLTATVTFDELVSEVRGNFRDPRAAEARWREIRRRGDEAAWDQVEFARPTPRVLERFARPVEDPDGTHLGWLEIYRDVTGEREKRSRLEQIEKMAALGQLVSGIAHELNNPLTSIVGYAQLLLNSAARPHSASIHGGEAENILAEAQRAGAIVRNLLLFAREESPERRAVNLNEIIERTVALRQYDLRLENIQVISDLESTLPAVHAEAQSLQQLVLNLLMNAEQALVSHRRATPGHIEIRTRSVQPVAPGRVRLEIRDDGPGIPREFLSRIFDPFFTTKPAGAGTGLGLSIVNAIVQSHGGEVRAESIAGRGAAFIVELPASSEPAELILTAQVAARATLPGAPHAVPSLRESRKILVVEDESTVAQLVVDVLRDEGHTVVAILDSFEALERLNREEFDLLICDLKMPRLDGRGLYEDALRRGRIRTDRVLFITGDTLRPRTTEFLKQSGLPYLAKPFLVEELTQAVRAILEGLPAPARNEEPSGSRLSVPRRGMV